MNQWHPTKWSCATDTDLIADAGTSEVTIERIVSPFYRGPRFAVRLRSYVLSVHAEWEHEPLLSSRDDAFYARCRFTSFEAARQAADEAISRMPQ